MQHKLRGAYQFHLLPLRVEAFPAHLQDDFRSLKDALDWLPAEGYGSEHGGTVRVTKNAMNDEEEEEE